nr:MAG TPA: hypothetical protein [Caudoviricetes sp.]
MRNKKRTLPIVSGTFFLHATYATSLHEKWPGKKYKA